MKSIALPFISYGMASVPFDICLESYVKGINIFKHLYETSILQPSLTDVYFVDCNNPPVKKFKEAFLRFPYLSISEEERLEDIEFVLYRLNKVNEFAANLRPAGFTTRESSLSSHRVSGEYDKTPNGATGVSSSERERERKSSVRSSSRRNSGASYNSNVDDDNSQRGSPSSKTRAQRREGNSLDKDPSVKVTTVCARNVHASVTIVIGCPFEKLATFPNFDSSLHKESGKGVFFNFICLPLEENFSMSIERSFDNLPSAISSYQRKSGFKDIKTVVITSKLLYADENQDNKLVIKFGQCLQKQLMRSGLSEVIVTTDWTFAPLLEQVFAFPPSGHGALDDHSDETFPPVRPELQASTSDHSEESDDCSNVVMDDPTDSQEKDSDSCVICAEPQRRLISMPCCSFRMCSVCRSKVQRCPSCCKPFGVLVGNQPEGDMTCSYVAASVLGDEEFSGSIVINYTFKKGIQSVDHSNPGKEYTGSSRKAYLPFNFEGIKVLKLLRLSFLRKLTFTIGKSSKTGKDNVIVWNDVHHKTSQGSGSYGYPDSTYLSRVQEELSQKGVLLSTMTEREKRDVDDFCKRALSKRGSHR
ncbi:uncharacterized protein LOC101853625 [Aplysia californica]|uniref:E3 ubiquitin-protein ligase n=1 Tax=Aplysia californica TaxID=6500 RepID=A0ABM1VUS6_APLCA|nr:uncharacterized protein LOC101853625 [Aplysia californica]